MYLVILVLPINTQIMTQIIWSTRRLVKVLLGIQQKFYQTSSRAIFLLLDVQQIFTPSKRRLVGSYFSATRRLVENFYQTSSTKSSTRCLVEQKIWAIVTPVLISIDYKTTTNCTTSYTKIKRPLVQSRSPEMVITCCISYIIQQY